MSATLIFDGDCGFCTASAHWVAARVDATDVGVEPWQRLDLDARGLTEPEVTTAAYWVEAGEHLRGARAIAAALRACRGTGWRALGRVIDLRPVRPLAAVGYSVVARNRHRLPGSTPACRTP